MFRPFNVRLAIAAAVLVVTMTSLVGHFLALAGYIAYKPGMAVDTAACLFALALNQLIYETPFATRAHDAPVRTGE